MLERREMLSASAFLQGIVTDANDMPLAGAVVTLFPHGGLTSLGAVSTGADGKYLFTTSSVPGLVPGAEYDLVETPPAGYSNSATSGFTQLSNIVGNTPGSFDINIPSPALASMDVEYTPAGPGGFYNNYDVLTWTLKGNPNPGGALGAAVELFPATVNGNSYMTLCADPAGELKVGVNSFSVLPTTVFPTASPSYSDRIGYLYNKYETQALDGQQAVGLQLAIWTLLYDAGGNLDNGFFVPADFSSGGSLTTQGFIDIARVPGYGKNPGYTTATFAQEEQQAADYLNESLGKSQPAWFLQVDGKAAISNGSQSLLATDHFNFINHLVNSPTINTTPGPAVVLGSGVKLTDTAVLAGAADYLNGDTITFTLYAPDGTTIVDTEIVQVTGNGSYTTPNGFLPTMSGTYQWVASFSGDANNKPVVSAKGDEPEKVTPAGPRIDTTPGGTVTIGNFTISGVKYGDLTGNGFSADDTAQGGVTINLYKETNNSSGLLVGSGGDQLVGTTTTASDGTYSFSITSSGTYYVQESVPAGYIQTGGGPSGSAGNAYYTVIAASGHTYSGYNFDDFQIPTCVPTCVTYTVVHNGYPHTVTDLAGNTQPGDTVTVNFTVPYGMNDELTLVSYYAPGATWSDSNAYQQLIYQKATGIFTPGTHSLTVKIPNSYYQIDFICGQAIDQLEPNQNGNAYGPDSAEILYHVQQRYISSDSGGSTVASLNASSPSVPTPTSSSSSATLPLTDSATLSGGYNPTGTITFYLFAPGVTPNATNSNNVYSDVVAVSGNGAYTTSQGNHPGGYAPTAPGAYQWVAVYSGDGANSGVTSPFGSEPETVSPNSPAIGTTPGGAIVIGSGGKLTDTAVLSGGLNPTGTIVFTLYSPGNAVVYTDTVTVNGNGTYATSAGTNPGGFLPTAVGTYQWVATYSGDANNASVFSAQGDEPETVNSASPAIDTTPGAAIVLGSGAKLTDAAVLSGGYNPTGTIVFTLYSPSNAVVYTDTVTVNGNGTYSTNAGTNPGGYLPTVVGTYQWVAAYSGDSKNASAAGAKGDEPELVTTAICISGTKFEDETGNGFSCDDAGLGGVTIKLYKDANGDGQLTSADGSPVATTSTASNGTYKFNNLATGTYFVQESVPSGYVQTGGGPMGSAGNTYYKVTATAGNTSSGNDFDDAELCDLSKVTCVSYVINGCTTVTDLHGKTHQGDTVTVYFTYTGSGSHDFSFVTYMAPGSSFDANTAYLQQIYQESTITVSGPGTYHLTVTIPHCYYQIDFVCGDAIDQLGPPGSGLDQANIFYTPQDRLISADNGGTCATPAVDNGDFATIGFWHNRNGQNLIKSLNGSSNSTALAEWLVTNFPKLYGAGASSAGTKLVNSDGSYFTNSQVASAYLTSAFFRASGQKTNAQILAAALAVYATDTDLAGDGAYASKYGFNTSLMGVGADTYKLGSNGPTFGESSYSTVTVFELLQDVNGKANSNGTLSSSLANAANTVFSDINQTGDITLLATGSELAVGDSRLMLSPAALASGQIWVSIVGLDPVFGAAQEASIDAGIASLDAQLGKYGITLVDVTAESGEADVADISITLADTTAIGGADVGVLGLTLFGGDVTLVNGWNWYYGADPTQIGLDQYDFQTVATHELGHAIGLGHSADETSVMFPYLSAGEARRTLSESDLSIIDAHEGDAPEPLMASDRLSPTVQAAIEALLGSDAASSPNIAASGGQSFGSPDGSGGSAGNGSDSLWGRIASTSRRRSLFQDFDSAADDNLAGEFASHAAHAAKALYQSTIDTIFSFFS